MSDTEVKEPKAVFTISGKAQEKLQHYADKFKVEFGYAMSIFMGYMSTGVAEGAALLSTMGALQNESQRQSFYVYVLNDSGPIDIFELMRLKVNRLFEDPATHDKAIEDGMVTEDGTVLDYRDKVYGKENITKGEPLTGSLYNRTILAIVASNENFDGATLSEITSQKEPAVEFPMVEPYNVYKALINQNRKNPLRYSFGKASKFTKIPSAVTNAEIANKITTVPIENLEEVYNAEFAGKKRTNYLVPIRGFVTYLNFEVIRGSRSLIITDQDTEAWINCRLNEKVPVVFKTPDEILAFARLYAGRNGKIGAEVKAYMVV